MKINKDIKIKGIKNINEMYLILSIRTLVVILELIGSLLLVNYFEHKKFSKASDE